ncbi:hypothetical protein ACLMJK_001423 [Lecanora helva]
MSNSTSDFQGWVDQPNTRGTFDIIQSSFLTIFFCTWTCLHLNVPAPNEGYWRPILRKFRWMVLTIFAPEFVFALAAGQRCDAKRVLDSLKRMGYHEWTLRHCFYSNMGGFVLHPRDSVPFPIHGFHFRWLLRNGYIELPSLKTEEIKDKSKADDFTKIVVCLQTGWFVLQCLARAAQRLPLTTLELLTMTYVWCTWAIYVEWLRKPLDVEVPMILKTEASTEEILIYAGPTAACPYRRTPLDFVWEGSPSWTLDFQPNLGFRLDPRRRPMPRILNDLLPRFKEASDIVIVNVVILAYAAIHLSGWNFTFQTQTEKTLWRIASLIILCTVAIFCILARVIPLRILSTIYPFRISERKVTPRSIFYVSTGKLERIVGGPGLPIRNRKEEKHVHDQIRILAAAPIVIVYVLARLCVMVEAFVALRALPRGCFENVNWTAFIPHF